MCGYMSQYVIEMSSANATVVVIRVVEKSEVYKLYKKGPVHYFAALLS